MSASPATAEERLLKHAVATLWPILTDDEGITPDILKSLFHKEIFASIRLLHRIAAKISL